MYLLRIMDFERVDITFCFKSQNSAKEPHNMLKSQYGDNVVTLTTIYKWYEQLIGRNESVEDGQRSGRPSTSKSDDNVKISGKNGSVKQGIDENDSRTCRGA